MGTIKELQEKVNTAREALKKAEKALDEADRDYYNVLEACNKAKKEGK